MCYFGLQGRVFLDRDPKHFRLILNFLRDGEVSLPSCQLELQELLQEAQFYQVCWMYSTDITRSSSCKDRTPYKFRQADCMQLDGLRLAVASQQRWLPNSAVQLRTSISQQLQVIPSSMCPPTLTSCSVVLLLPVLACSCEVGCV